MSMQEVEKDKTRKNKTTSQKGKSDEQGVIKVKVLITENVDVSLYPYSSYKFICS